MDWLKKALGTVYGEDGIVGLVVVVALLGGLLWLFGDKIIVLLGG